MKIIPKQNKKCDNLCRYRIMHPEIVKIEVIHKKTRQLEIVNIEAINKIKSLQTVTIVTRGMRKYG